MTCWSSRSRVTIPRRRKRFSKSSDEEVRGPGRQDLNEGRVSETVISISRLTRRFGARTALDSVSLLLPRGAVYGLVGANGAGKTTLIKHILGLYRAESGSVRVFGRDPVAD